MSDDMPLFSVIKKHTTAAKCLEVNLSVGCQMYNWISLLDIGLQVIIKIRPPHVYSWTSVLDVRCTAEPVCWI